MNIPSRNCLHTLTGPHSTLDTHTPCCPPEALTVISWERLSSAKIQGIPREQGWLFGLSMHLQGLAEAHHAEAVKELLAGCLEPRRHMVVRKG